MTPLSYSIAIATRNRLDALKLSIPLMLNQSRPPSQLIVVDSSDNHEPVKELVQSLTDKTPLDTIVYHSPKGLTRQRNKALEYVTHPIVFFPDDDSIWFNNTA
ncbi:MAG: glycosyltransferase, partial [Pirellulales bacterium]|nr:glycosyltransferase [Pirellulales bacterium]